MRANLSENSHLHLGGPEPLRDGTDRPAGRDGGAGRGTPRLPADFSPQGYRDRNPELRDLSDDEAGLHYAAAGKASGLAYRPDQMAGFDPDHFRETHPAFAHADDATCLAAWQAQGGAEGDPGHQAAHLARLGLSLRAYPAAFPWRFYTRLYPRAAAHRWAALAHFLREGFAESGEQIPYGEDAASFLIAVGDHFAARHSSAAIRAYELAAARAPSRTTRARLAEAYGRAGAWSAALALYEELLDDEELLDGLPGSPAADAAACEVAFRGFVTAAAARAAWPRLFARLPRALAGPVPAPLGDALVRDAAERYFAERGRAARALYAQGRREEGDACLAEAIRGVADLSAACLPAGTRAPSPEPFVAVLADGLPDGARRRLERSIDLLGCAVRVFDLGAVRAFEEALPEAHAAIVVRMPAWPTVVQALVRARRLGVPTVYETDELTVDPHHAPPPLAAFAGRIGEQVYDDLVFGVALYRGAAALCAYGLAPTRALAAHLDRVVGTGRSFVVRDVAVPDAASRETGDGIGLFLHAARSRVVGPADATGAALLHVLEREPQVRLTTAGFVLLDDAFAPFSDRITQAGPVRDWEEALRGCDLNLVPADGSEAEACLAPTGWLAAARFGIPTLADDTPAHRETLQDGVDIHLAAGRDAWTTALATLVAAPDRRAALGSGAARRLRSTHAPEAAAAAYRAMIETLRSRRP
ncbi:glycosyltransferase [Methylobacterium sp. 17Sr1-1]|uniref:glycosyltransferase n=1 Tax=Methylobacterium sp. 17Sr1-1 TaxID=2202826 RepID=UPI000D6F29FC|nr:glycosyltransferase [Methylobacterium sp. 17Sr1-1]AWN52814.1 group 1 glycosyl transferase [Methylobacterium sp. 17Sr1-1]